MSDVIERAARRLFSETTAHRAALGERLPPCGWDDGADQPYFRFLVRAVLEELREPSEEMLDAVYPRGISVREQVAEYWRDVIDGILRGLSSPQADPAPDPSG